MKMVKNINNPTQCLRSEKKLHFRFKSKLCIWVKTNWENPHLQGLVAFIPEGQKFEIWFTIFSKEWKSYKVYLYNLFRN